MSIKYSEVSSVWRVCGGMGLVTGTHVSLIRVLIMSSPLSHVCPNAGGITTSQYNQ